MSKQFTFVIQKQNNGIHNSYFENIKAFSSNIKALKFCRKHLKLEPLNWTTLESFLASDIQLFGLKEQMGTNVDKVVQRYRIQKLEME